MKRLKDLKTSSKIKLGLVLVLICLVLAGGMAGGLVFSMVKKLPPLSTDSLSYSFDLTSQIYDSSGLLMENVEAEEARSLVSLDQVPDNLIDAFLAIEDRGFYDHGGLDLRGLVAALQDNLEAGDLVRGGSTITQQLVKNVYLSSEKSLERKVQEAYLAFRLEEALSKDEILEAYLNRVNLGLGAYGVQAASQAYFSKDVEELDLAESALLAGIVKSPSAYQPIHRYPKDQVDLDEEEVLAQRQVGGQDMVLVANPRALDRQDLVLEVMAQAGYVSREEAEAAKAQDLDFDPYDPKPSKVSSYPLDYIKEEAGRILEEVYDLSPAQAQDQVLTGGYQVYSTIDTRLQEDLEDLYEDFGSFISSGSRSSRAALLDFKLDEESRVLDHFGRVLYLPREAYLDQGSNLVLGQADWEEVRGDIRLGPEIFLEDQETPLIKDLYAIDESGILYTTRMGAINIGEDFYKKDEDGLVISKDFLKSNPDFCREEEAGSLIISRDYLDMDPQPVPQPQASTVIMDNDTGAVVALVGGLDLRSSRSRILNRAHMTLRSPGSALTPLTVYAPALEEGLSLAESYDDVPIRDEEGDWLVNRDGRYRGHITLGQAFLKDRATVRQEVLEDIGLEAPLEVLGSLGFYRPDEEKDLFVSSEDRPDRNDMSLEALAQGDLTRGFTNTYMTSAYRSLVNGGRAKAPQVIKRIIDAQGQVVFDLGQVQEEAALSQETAYLLQTLLERNARENLPGLGREEVMAILGLNKFNSDFWVMGSVPSHTVGLWIGADSPLLFLSKEEGLASAWYGRVLDLLPSSGSLPKAPGGILKKTICRRTGELASTYCLRAGDGVEEYFVRGTQPKEESDSHVRRLICRDSGLLASQYCPHEGLIYGYYYVRPGSYDASAHNNTYPEDIGLVPSSYCNIHTEEVQEEDVEENGLDGNDN